jgi:short subunit dehydrogenase-like uncharacterized protein
MSHSTWMIYGATGTTGTLIAEEAVRRGHQPVLAGRSAASLAALGKRLGLPWKAVSLDQPDQLQRAVSEVDAVLNSNSLVKYVADQLPGATMLELAVKADNGQASQGATKSRLEVLASGGRVYRDGHLVPYRLGKGLKALRFPDGTVDILPVPSGDLEAAYRATGIPNITAFVPFRRSAALLLPLLQFGLALRPIRERLGAALGRRGTRQPESQADGQRTSYAWARATNQSGQSVEAWLELGEGYQFTAASSVQAIEHVLRERPSGALTPAQAFGADFVLNIEGVRRSTAAPLAHPVEENQQ